MTRLSKISAAAAGLCAVSLVLPSCSGSTAPQIKAQSDGTMAMSRDGQLLYVASADDNTVVVVDPSTFTVVATVPVGQTPSRLAVGPDDTIYVTNNGSRSVSMIHRGTWTVASTLSVGAGPVGLAVSADGNTLYVVNSAAATLQAIDLGKGNAQRWLTTLAAEPRAVAVLPDGRLYVTHLKSGLVDILDGQSGNLMGSTSAAVGVDPASAAHTIDGANGPVTTLPTFRPVGLDSIVVSHDGSRAYFVHRRDRTGLLAGNLTTPVVVPAITTVELATDTPRDDATDSAKDFPPPVIFPGPSEQNPGFVAGGCAGGGAISGGENGGTNGGGIGGGSTGGFAGFPDGGPTNDGSIGSDNSGSTAYGVQSGGGGSVGNGCAPVRAMLPWTQGPVAAIEDPNGQFLYIANLNSDNVTVLATTNRTQSALQGAGSNVPADAFGQTTVGAAGTANGVVQLIPVGAAPSGLAMSQDGKTLFVHNSLDHSLSFIQAGPDGTLVAVNSIDVGTPGNLDPVAANGRKLFFSATSPAMTLPGGGIACESCHLGASSDGNVWQFPFGPRKTPNLLGRKVQDTAPYHWDGTETDFTSFFAETIQMRMGGQGLQSSTDPTKDQPTQIETYLQGLQTPDNPFVQPGGLTATQAAGKALFDGKAGCIACHSGAHFTDNSFHDVGSFVAVNPNGASDDLCRVTPGMGPCTLGTDGPNTPVTANPANTVHGFNTPSLLGVVWAAPYLHSGAAATLKDRLLENPGDAHGTTSILSSDEIDDLVDYLQTL